jgi:hypothetical protein
MSIQHIYIRAYGPTVSGRNRGTPDRGRYTDPPCTLALQQQLDAEKQQGQGQQQFKTRPTSAIGNVSIESKNNNNNALPPFFWRGVGWERGASPGSPDSLSCRHPVYMSRDKTWRKSDRVIGSLKYGKRTQQRNPAEVFYHLPNTRPMTCREPSLE